MTNHFLYRPGGSEQWTYTVAGELMRRGHSVEIMARVPGLFAERFQCPVVTAATDRYDLALVNHNSCLDEAAAHSDRVIMTCHGVIPDLEQPAAGAQRYVAVSDEVRDHMRSAGFDATVIRNPIDCELFSPKRPIRPTLRRVLSLCQGEEATAAAEAACKSLDVEFLAIRGARVYGIAELLQEVDLVVGLGRTAMEAMACGRNVLVMDSREYSTPLMDGIVDSDRIAVFMRSNFSGRAMRIVPTPEGVREELLRYSPELGAVGREFALAELELSQQVDKYLELADEVVSPDLVFIKDAPDYSHLSDRERFAAMYNEVGTIDANRHVVWRSEWMSPFLPDPESRILELGAHNGPNLIHYARLGHQVDGVEISETLKATFERFASFEPLEVQNRMRMFQGWIEEYVSDTPYDHVLCTEVLEHVPDPVAVLHVAEQSLKIDGTIYISSPSSLWGNNTHVRAVDSNVLRAWLDEAGLVAESMWESNGRTFCFARRRRAD